ncbi:MAG TPA: hypothetical protein VH796_18020 [Nitrososphaeraceae archaeon]
MNTPTTNSEQLRPIARRSSIATPIDAITAPPIVRILLTIDIPNSSSPTSV